MCRFALFAESAIPRTAHGVRLLRGLPACERLRPNIHWKANHGSPNQKHKATRNTSPHGLLFPEPVGGAAGNCAAFPKQARQISTPSCEDSKMMENPDLWA